MTDSVMCECCLYAATMLKFFSRYGEVIDCVVMKNPNTGKSRGFGFVTFKDPSCVETVLSSGPHVLDSRQVRIEIQHNTAMADLDGTIRMS